MRFLWVLVRSIWYWWAFLTFTVGALILTSPLWLTLSPRMHGVGRFWGRVIWRILGQRVQVEGLEKFHRAGPVIIVSNHQSLLDVPAFFAVFPIDFTFMAKSSLFKIPAFGRGMRSIRCIPVDREDRRKAQESMFRAAEIVRTGVSVVVYPEGTRGFPDGTLRPFKRGAFLLAEKARVVVQPITIWGASNVVPKQMSHWMQRVYPAPVKIIVHDPIPPESYVDRPIEELASRVEGAIAGPLPRLRAEMPLGVHVEEPPQAAGRAAG